MELEKQATKIELVSDEASDLGQQSALPLPLVMAETPKSETVPVQPAKPWTRPRAPVKATKLLPCGLPDHAEQYAGFWRRLAAHLIDWLVISLLGSIVVLIAVTLVSGGNLLRVTSDVCSGALFLGFFGFFWYGLCTALTVLSSFLAPAMTRALHVHNFDDGLVYFAFVLGPLIVDALYRSVLESSPKQATLGKQLLKIYVAGPNGERLTFARALLRHLLKAVSGLTLLLGYILAATGVRKQALHDKLAHTFVIKEGWTPPAVPKLDLQAGHGRLDTDHQ